MTRGRIVIAGGSGFLGQKLGDWLATEGWEVLALTRSGMAGGVPAVKWDGRTVGAWAESLEGAAGLVNLSGRSVNARHTEAVRREIERSRVEPIEALAEAMRGLSRPPAVWVQTSAVGIYGDRGEAVMDEGSPPGDEGDFMVRVCRAWEGAFEAAADLPVRRVLLRTGVVLGRESGALPVLAKLTRWFLGGRVGTGRQYMSWIHVRDWCRIVGHVLGESSARGIYNATAPDPQTNAQFMTQLRRTLGRPWSPPAPALAVRLGARLMGTEASLALRGQRCVPARLLREGFAFDFPDVRSALEDLLRR